MSRITIKNLERLADQFNRETGSPLAYCSAPPAQFCANVGNYHIDAAYGGYALVRTCNTSGQRPIRAHACLARWLPRRARAILAAGRRMTTRVRIVHISARTILCLIERTDGRLEAYTFTRGAV